MRKMSKEAAFHEVYNNEPKAVKKSGKKGKAKQKMMVAIAMSKAGLDMMKKGHRRMK